MKIKKLLMMLVLGIHFPALIIAQNFETDSFPEISISMKENLVTVSVNLNKKFTWEGVRCESLKKFPQPWVGLSDLPHEIWFEKGGNMTWRQTDMMFIGNYKILINSFGHEIEASVLGYLNELTGKLDSETNLLRFDSLDYALFYKLPNLIIERSSDMLKWSEVKLTKPLPKEYQWPLSVSMHFDMEFESDAFFRVKVIND